MLRFSTQKSVLRDTIRLIINNIHCVNYELPGSDGMSGGGPIRVCMFKGMLVGGLVGVGIGVNTL